MKRVITFTCAIFIWAAPLIVLVPKMSSVASSASSITVSSAAELLLALSKAKGGEIILLQPGNYGDLTLNAANQKFAKFADTVTVASADPQAMASFSSFKLVGVENFKFESLKFDYVAQAGAPEWVRPFQIIGGSNNITISDSIFDGDAARGVSEIVDGYGTGIGLGVTGATNISLENSEFFNWHRAASFGSVQNLKVLANDIHSVRSDGFNFADVSNVLIEGNYLHDFRGAPNSGDHMDMIQFWTAGTKSPSTNIVIRSNVLDSGDGNETQSIFMRNELVDTGQAGAEMFYRNVIVENNVIYNGHTHGITVGETNGLLIRNNTVLQNKASVGDLLVHVPTINVSERSTDVSILNNVVPRLAIKASDSVISQNNLIVQRDQPSASNYYGDLFVNALADGKATLLDLNSLPGGLVEQLGVGSSLSRFPGQSDAPIGTIANKAGFGLSMYTHTFEVRDLIGPGGAIDAGGAIVKWDFGDGTSATGVSAKHSFGNAGYFDVRATITLADSNTVVVSKTVRVESPVALNVKFDAGSNDLSNSSSAVKVGDAVTFEADGKGGQAARLGEGVITYARGPQLRNNDEYTVLFDVKKDVGAETAAGRVIAFVGSFVLSLQANGVTAEITTDKGGGTLQARGVGLQDSGWHQVALTFSGKNGFAALYLDGKEVARLDGLSGHVQVGSASHDFNIGYPWGGNFPGLIDNVSFLRAALTDEQVASYYKSPWDFHPTNLSQPQELPFPVSPSNDRGDLDLDHYPRVLAANFEIDAKDLSDVENVVTVGKAVTFEGCESGQAARLNGGVITYARSPELYNNPEYTLLFDFKKDSGAESSGGRVVNFSYSFILFIEADGVTAAVTTDKGDGWIKARGVGIKDSDWHQVALTFSGDDGAAVLYVDGTEVGRLDGLEGHIQKGNPSHSLNIGDPWGNSFPGLIDNLVFLQGAMTAEEVQANYETPYDFCQQETTFAAAAENSLQATSGDASGSSATFVAPADSTNKMTTSTDSSATVKTASTPVSSNTPATATTQPTNEILLTASSPSLQPTGQTDSFVFTASHSLDGDASDELLIWSPDESETTAVASDFGLAEELTQVHDAHTPDLLLG